MTKRTKSLLARHYEDLEAEACVSDDAAFAQLVVPNGNAATPFHRWFHLKESFSSDLLQFVLERLQLSDATGLRLVDPFAGVATSVISALEINALSKPERFKRVVGIERNPFLHLVGSAKVRARVNPPADFDRFIERVTKKFAATSTRPAMPPALSTFANSDYFPPAVLRDLLRLKTAVETARGDELSKDIARVCLAGCLEPVSNLRRDGRALRFERRPRTLKPYTEFLRRIRVVTADLKDSVNQSSVDAYVALGDGRAAAKHLRRAEKFDLALFSPPYPNNIDYTEVYKLENWFLDLIGTEGEFRAQRLRTIRSHPSVVFDESHELSENGFRDGVESALSPLLEAIPNDRYRHQRRRLVQGYFEDMLRTLKGVHDVLADGGQAVYVVGNSVHGHGEDSFVIGSDLLMAALARLVGFEVDELIIARFPARRNMNSANAPARFLRESVVVLRK